MRAVTRSLKLIDAKLRENAEANRLFLEILTSQNDAETVLRRMNEAGVLGQLRAAPSASIVAMMQFNMYHHYTVDEHLLRCIGMLHEHRSAARNDEYAARQRADARRSSRSIARCSTSRCSCTTSPRAASRIIRSPARGWRGASARASVFRPPETETVAWLIEQHLAMSTRRAVARPVRPQDHREFRRGGAVARAHEAADHPHHRRHPRGRARRLERLEGAAHPHALLRDRAGADRRLLRGQPRPARRRWRRPNSAPRSRIGRPSELDAYIARHYPAYWLKVDLPHKVAHARFVRADRRRAASDSPPRSHSMPTRGVTELTVLAPDHPRLLSIIAGACAMAGANIVDAQIYTTTDGARARHHLGVARIRARRGRAAPRRHASPRRSRRRCAATLRLPDVVAQARAAQGPHQGLRARAGGRRSTISGRTATPWSR